jgi:hypothetical protein
MIFFRIARRANIATSIALLVFLNAHLCRAADNPPTSSSSHRLTSGVGVAPVTYQYSEFKGSEARNYSNPDAGIRAAYGRVVTQGLEVGAAVEYLLPIKLLTPTGTIRGFLTLGTSPAIELGASGRLGAAFALKQGDSGWAAALGPDVLVWVHPAIGCKLGVEYSVASASSSTPRVHTFAYRNVSGWFSVVVAL